MRSRPGSIRDAVLPVSSWNPEEHAGTFRYVDIGAIDRENKVIIDAPEIDASAAPTRARQLLRRDDVLVSTVRPGLNAVAMVPAHLDGAVGSTGFTVLRPNPARVASRFLFHWVRTPAFVDAMVRQATGASYPAVSDRIVLDSTIRLPDPADQEWIASVLDKADSIRRRRKDAISLTDELLRSTFLDMFGDPVVNPKGWRLDSVGALCLSRQYGTAFKANSDSRGTPVLRMSNVTYDGRVDLRDMKWVELDDVELAKLDLREGDVLFNRVNSLELVGKTAVWPGEGGYTFAGYLIRLRMDPARAVGEYVSAAMNMPSMKIKLENMAKPSINMANISSSDLDRLTIPVPSIPLQQAYRHARRRLLGLRGRFQMALAEGEALANALSSTAFSMGAA